MAMGSNAFRQGNNFRWILFDALPLMGHFRLTRNFSDVASVSSNLRVPHSQSRCLGNALRLGRCRFTAGRHATNVRLTTSLGDRMSIARRKFQTLLCRLPSMRELQESVITVLPELFVGFALAFHVIPEYVVDVILCDGPSMMPTLLPKGEVILVVKCCHLLWGIEDGCSGPERSNAARRRRIQDEAILMEETSGKIDPGSSTDAQESHFPSPELTVASQDQKSMSLKSGSWWYKVLSALTSGLKKGDVVVVEHPLRDGTVCKRIIGLPGDVVVQQLPHATSRESMSVVPDGHIWLEGDNSLNSTDSRSYGAVPAALVVGKVIMRIWPLRGQAVMDHEIPKRHDGQHHFLGSTVLPAGYHGAFDVTDDDFVLSNYTGS